ncbi:hypothetical protein ASPZODRAFT_18394 [Penicilliopsis zonata CBS 506.65]|uniref:FUN14 domain-containing protein n=1 Tax=Penicilliopsis zonata CBS 506.65 TaxID=1073090 RepID=A0A1L9SC97_9EURO|nr:hypothetical protein ASPZODRAFT_18394 [Penicilliopsis zonata CBS 506.65]OJJ44835.1 hypothetical protein ASPZODRAFT_18394 [Penicilliopsis zonata CBS 506.65]
MSFLRPSILGIGVGLSFALHPLSPLRSPPMQTQYTAPHSRSNEHPHETVWSIANDEVLNKQGKTGIQNSQKTSTGMRTGLLNASTMRQVSLGSVLGLMVGVGLRAFSRALVVLLGMGIVIVEWAAARGYNLIPVNWMQKYVKGVDVQRALTVHMPFKMSFGLTMTLAAFARF